MSLIGDPIKVNLHEIAVNNAVIAMITREVLFTILSFEHFCMNFQ